MKKGILVLLMGLLVQTSAFAGTGDVGSVDIANIDIDSSALKALLLKNPNATSPNGDGGQVRVSEIVAMGMTSSFDKNGKGALTVSTNNCEAASNKKNVFRCTLNMLNSDRVITKKGAYAQAPGMTESAYTIQYIYSIENGKETISEVSFSLAG